ncbi:hypothetical protein F66182_106 [Fusarium sp. NRRL 66182]|nr:hypothetical protein F66182_106 [Fusarium sp. NRRL 66182]
MVLFKRLIAASPLLPGIAAQSGGGERVWAAVAFINHGERVPIASNLRTVLTPEGAQQLLRQGTAFRARYVPDGVDGSDYEDIQTAYLQNLNADVINNDDLDVISQDDEWVSAGAMAFMQGFYPPVTDAYDNSTGGEEIAINLASSANRTEYPLDGYQYPVIKTPSNFDLDSTSIQGNARCTAWYSEVTSNMTQNEILGNLYESTLPFYRRLFSTPPLAGTIEIDLANLWNAYGLWEFVDYQYRHNETVHEGLNNATETLELLNTYALSVERAQNSYLDSQGDDDPLDVIYSIAGRLLAHKVTSQFRNTIRWDSAFDKLTLIFGSIEPIVSFISLSGLLTPENINEEPFRYLPEPGAALVFELHGENPDQPDQQPPLDSLRVKMSYRASTDPNEPFTNWPLFSSGPDGIAYSRFMEIMNEMGRSPYQWCGICGPSPAPAPWCVIPDSDDDNSIWDDSSSIAPAIAGVIGAAIMLGLIVFVILGLFLLGGFRLRRKEPAEEPHDTGAAGGFKGPEKKDGDADVVVTKQGVHHERIGSWELRSPNDLPQTSGIVTKDLGSPRRRSLDDSDDDISVIGAAPVKARESV